MELMRFAGNSIGNYLSSCSEGNCDIPAIASSIVNSGLDLISFNTLKKIEKEFVTTRKMIKGNYKPKGFLSNINQNVNKENKIIKNIAFSAAKKSLSILLEGLNKGDFTIDLIVDIIIEGCYSGINSANKEIFGNKTNLRDMKLKARTVEEMKQLVLTTEKEMLKGLITDCLNGMITIDNFLEHILKGGFKGFKNIKKDFMK